MEDGAEATARGDQVRQREGEHKATREKADQVLELVAAGKTQDRHSMSIGFSWSGKVPCVNYRLDVEEGMRMEETKEHYLRTFETLLYDAVYQLYFAFDINLDDYKDDVRSPFVRASTLSSMLLLECGANCLIDSLDLPKSYYIDIDKLPFLSKFEFFLHRLDQNQKFDRGCKEVQAILELKKIRDTYVHPKVRRGTYLYLSRGFFSARTSEHGQTGFLKFPHDLRKWDREHAILALRSVNDFYNKYFLEWCQFDVDAVVDLLLSSEKVDIASPVGACIDCIGGLDRAVVEWGIDFKFIGKRCAN